MTRQFRGRSVVWVACSVVALAAMGGCPPKRFIVSTRIDPAGEFDRSFVQPDEAGFLPPEALTASKAGEAATQPADGILRPGWRDRWRQCGPTSAPADSEGSYLAASGHFLTADLIPGHYHIALPTDASRAATSRIVHVNDDYLLFSIDTWQEEITETIRLDEYAASAEQMARQVAETLGGSMQTALADRYDATGLRKWLVDTAAPAYVRFAFWFYQQGHIESVEDLDADALSHLQEILAPLHIRLPMTPEGLAGDDHLYEEALRAALTEIFAETLQDLRSGQPITSGAAQALTEELFTDQPADTQPAGAAESNAKAPTSQPASAPADLPDRLEQIFEGLFEQQYGCTIEDALVKWRAAQGGAHARPPLFIGGGAADFLGSGAQYQFTVETAGPILETDGDRLASDRVQWTFSADELWPRGTSMYVRAVRWNREAEKRVFGKIVLQDVDQVLKVMQALDADNGLADALAEAIEQGELKPLTRYYAEHESARLLLELGSTP